MSLAGDTLATHGRGGAMRGRRQLPEILITRPPTATSKQGKFQSAIETYLVATKKKYCKRFL